MRGAERRAGHRLDDVDRRLLAVLQEQGRIPVNGLAAAASVSRATAYSRFERLQRSGAIRGFHADVEPGALGYGVAAMVLVNIEQGAWATAASSPPSRASSTWR